MLRSFTVAALVAVWATPAFAQKSAALTGDNTKIEFVGTKKAGKHTGGFKKLTGTAKVGADPTALKLDIEIDVDSIYTDDAKLTGHLKSPDFFDAKKHPKSKFELTKVEKSGADYTLKGKLTMLGKTKEISVPAKVTQTADNIKVESSFKIDRTDFGMTYGKGQVDNDVSLTVKIDAKVK